MLENIYPEGLWQPLRENQLVNLVCQVEAPVKLMARTNLKSIRKG
jgi:hypothetical protein